MSDPNPLPRSLWILSGVIALIYAVGLFNHGPIPSMEPRFAEAVREMMTSGQYLIPVKNGLPYIEYPPLYFWLGLAGHAAGLPIPAAIRLPGYLAFIAWILWLPRLNRRLFPAWPAFLPVVVATALPVALYSFFTAQSDSLLVLGVAIAWAGFAGFRAEGHKRFPWELWLGATLAMAAKGPVGIVLTLVPMGLEMVWSAWRQGTDLRQRWQRLWALAWPMAWLRGIALILLFNLPWYLAAGATVGWPFIKAVVIYQNFTRFLVGFDHGHPWWFYATTIWGDFAPGSLLLPFGLYFAWRRRDERSVRLVLSWALFTLVFFSISQSKQGKYILPAAPAYVALMLIGIEGLWKEVWARRARHALAGLALLMIGVFAGAVFFWLPGHAGDIGGAAQFSRIRDELAANPGHKIVAYRWPRSMTLYELGGPMPWVRSARDLYRRIDDGDIKPGDYLLVNVKYLPEHRPAPPSAVAFFPGPTPDTFRKVLQIDAEDGLALYVVLRGARDVPAIATPQPPPHHWWEQFDTD